MNNVLNYFSLFYGKKEGVFFGKTYCSVLGKAARNEAAKGGRMQVV